MRVFRFTGRVLALVAFLVLPAHADPACELILRVRPGAEARALARADALGLRHAGELSAGLALPPAAAHDRFVLDAARVVRLVARDPAAANAALHALAADPAVAWVEANAAREAAVVRLEATFPDDPLYRAGRQWGLSDDGGRAGVRAREAWAASVGANALRLALADTGIDPAQPDLGGAMPDGGPRIVDGVNVTETMPRSNVADSIGHGTAVAGVMAARTNDGAHFDSLGVAGVCGGDGAGNAGCRIVPIRITPDRATTATAWDVSRAILHATATGARAMNLSFAGGAPSRLERLAMRHAIAHGCVVVAAAGNRGASNGAAPQYPAAYAAEGLCIQVGASDAQGARAAFSSHGPGLDVLAPGVDVWTTSITYANAYATAWPGVVIASGTSIAAPFATGAVGLLAAARPALGDVDFQHLLRATARDVGPPGDDAEHGAGLLDAAAALAAVRPEVGLWRDEIAVQAVRALDEDTLIVEPGGEGALAGWRGAYPARRFEALATVALPDSFVAVEHVWARLVGTSTARGDFRLDGVVPWAEASVEGRRLALRGYLYRTLEGDGVELPVPFDQARIGFTVIGSVDRTPAPPPAAPRPALTAAPNPFRDQVRLMARAGDVLVVHDVAGRRWWRGRAAADGVATWDGRDAGGAPAPTGLYLVRRDGATGVVRLLRLAPGVTSAGP